MTTSPLESFHASNLLTYGSLAAAFAAVAAATSGNGEAAGAFIAAAVIADTFDGRFARLFRRTPRQRAFGAHLDSLADAAAFGMTPVVCMAALAPRPASAVLLATWWAVVVLYASSAITRLAFFNLQDPDAGFVGLPVPVAALVWASALLFEPGLAASLVLFAATAVAMVAPIRLPRPAGAGLAVFACWPLAVLAAHVAALAR